MNFFYEQRNESSSIIRANKLTFNPHIHTQVEVVYLKEGKSHCVIDGQEYLLNEGEAIIVFPNHIHSYRDDDKVKTVLMFIDPLQFPEFNKIFNSSVPFSPVISKYALCECNFDNIINTLIIEYHNGTDIIKKGCMLVLIGKLLSACKLTKISKNENNLIKDLLYFCENNYKEKITLLTTSKALNVSASYLSHIFSQKLMISFNDYINMLRINEASRLLKEIDKTITEISYMCGFSTIRSFNRAFKKQIGKTPTEYRN